MSKPRIFISHSAKETEVSKFLEDTYQALVAAGFDVLVDRKRLEAGQNWRDEIYTWMGLCHAAIVLISDSACGSLWVQREASILMWRRLLDPGFKLIPVYLNGATPKMAKEAFADLKFEEVQAAIGGNAEEQIAAIKHKLEELREDISETPVESVAAQISHWLEVNNVPENVIGKVSTELGIGLGPWGPLNDKRRLLALQLLQVNLRKAADAISSLVEYSANDVSGDRLLALVAPAWVDICAARWVADCSKRKDVKPIIVLNAQSFYSAQMYVRRASSRPPRTSWPIYPCPEVYGEQLIEELVSEIENILIKALPISLDPYDICSLSEKLNEVLQDRHQEGKPIFIVLKYSEEFAKQLPSLQQKLPFVTFFLLTGDEIPATIKLNTARIHCLEPQLTPGRERDVRRDYDYARSLMGGS